jgi:hypothetical protein
MPKNSPWLAEKSTTAGGKSAMAGGKIRYGWRKIFRHQWRNNLQWAAEKSTMDGGKILHF